MAILTHYFFTPKGSNFNFKFASRFSNSPKRIKEYQYLKRMFNADIIQGFGYTYDLQDLDYNGQYTIEGANNVVAEKERILKATKK